MNKKHKWFLISKKVVEIKYPSIRDKISGRENKEVFKECEINVKGGEK